MTSDTLPMRSKADAASSVDIVGIYNRLLAGDAELTKPMAAIEALIEVLGGASQVTTVAETIDLVEAQSAKLQAGVANPIAPSHGTHLFRQYLIMSLKQPGPGGHESVSVQKNFDGVRAHLLKNSRLIAERAKDARERIAANARGHVRDGATVLTYGGSRVVGTLLGRAAEGADRRDFRVIYVVDPAIEAQSNKTVAALRAKGVPVATVPLSAVAYSMAKVDMVIVGAEAVTSGGGIISRLGTFQIAQLAELNKKPFYVAAEQYKFGKTFPAGQFSYSFDQNIIDFRAGGAAGKPAKEPMQDPIDFTKSQYIKAFFADHKVLTPAEVAKEIIDMLF